MPPKQVKAKAPAVKKNEGPAPAEEKDLVPCAICSRKFASDRIEKHKVICEKTTAKEREAFDVREQRLDGTEAIKYKDVEPNLNVEKADWKKTHINMMSAIKEAKKTRPPSAKKQEIEVQIVVK
eukprot:TRINITY_DN43997_c0_g1_i2.p2 TRINITY_DN43997_c0_g1~~TRINITY_DN43997_c0_g1_i2.p2  ORF type:complete len:124 (+),score=51.94 TRINITY_DN43997_c0_g1_i2:292-663(+)